MKGSHGRITLPERRLDVSGVFLSVCEVTVLATVAVIRCIFEPSQLIYLLRDARRLRGLSSARLSCSPCPICKGCHFACVYPSWHNRLEFTSSQPLRPPVQTPSETVVSLSSARFPQHRVLNDTDIGFLKNKLVYTDQQQHGNICQLNSCTSNVVVNTSQQYDLPPEHHRFFANIALIIFWAPEEGSDVIDSSVGQ